MHKIFAILAIIVISVSVSPPLGIGGETNGYRVQSAGCPDPFSIDHSNFIRYWPLDDVKFNQTFKWSHPGVDLYAYPDQPIYSVGYGFVSKVMFAPQGYGWYVLIQHPKDWETLYAHMHYEPLVKEGEYVFPGKQLGYAGTTGNSTGVHLHFETINNSCYIDPITLISE